MTLDSGSDPPPALKQCHVFPSASHALHVRCVQILRDERIFDHINLIVRGRFFWHCLIDCKVCSTSSAKNSKLSTRTWTTSRPWPSISRCLWKRPCGAYRRGPKKKTELSKEPLTKATWLIWRQNMRISTGAERTWLDKLKCFNIPSMSKLTMLLCCQFGCWTWQDVIEIDSNCSIDQVIGQVVHQLRNKAKYHALLLTKGHIDVEASQMVNAMLDCFSNWGDQFSSDTICAYSY